MASFRVVVLVDGLVELVLVEDDQIVEDGFGDGGFDLLGGVRSEGTR
jgi:hypothetical protein